MLTKRTWPSFATRPAAGLAGSALGGLRCAVLLSILGLAAPPAPATEPQEPEKPRREGWLSHLRNFRLDYQNQRDHAAMRDVFRDIVRDARKSTVRIYSDGQQTAQGAVVRSDGLIVSKASELQGKIECLLHDGRRLPAQRVSADREYDLVLLRVESDNLTPLTWSTQSPGVGSWLATTGTAAAPVAIGVVSTPPRRIAAGRPILGVRLEPTAQGPRIREVVQHSGADRAGLRVGDVVQEINGTAVKTPQAVVESIARFWPGDRIAIKVRRGEHAQQITATLGKEIVPEQAEQVAVMETLAGPLSSRRHGFPVALQHDTVLRPRDCGGPLVDLEGRAVGLNIARASRVATYALPAETVRAVVERLLPAP